MRIWPQQFPRFNELYERSDQMHHDNCFRALGQPPVALDDELWGKFFDWYEQRLQRLDAGAWEQLLIKCLPYVCRKDRRRGWEQLWNHLNEALGYALLAERGYSKIQFIDRGDEGTPDLTGAIESVSEFVEVKTVNCSDEDINRRNEWPPVARDVGYGLPPKFSAKVLKTIDESRNQLLRHAEPADVRIILLVVSFDSDFKFVGENYRQLQELVAANRSSEVELVLQILNQSDVTEPAVNSRTELLPSTLSSKIATGVARSRATAAPMRSKLVSNFNSTKGFTDAKAPTWKE